MPTWRGSARPDSVRILITGAGGFVAGHLIRDLLRTGETITGGTLDGGPPDGGSVLSPEERSGVEWIRADVASESSLTDAVGAVRPEVVFHLAAQSSVGASFEEPVLTWDVNATGTFRLLRVLGRQQGPRPRVLVVSSAEVYGPVPEDEQPIRESAPLRPVNPYGASKAAAEMAALAASAAGNSHVVIARSFNHTGPGQDVRFSLPSFARQLASFRGRRDPVLRVGNLSARRDFLDVRDVVRAYRCLIERGENGGVYNVCSGEARELRSVVEQMIELSGSGARIQVDPDRVRSVDTPLIVGDPVRIRALGWEPRIPLRQTLADLLAAAR